MSTATASERVSGVQSRLRQALETWNSSDLTAIEESVSLLETSAVEFQQLQNDLLLGRLTPTPNMRAGIAGISRQIRQLTRLVDASSAFVQGMAVYTGTRSQRYNASGQIEMDTVLSGMREL
jgi:hypothetical protein